MLQLSQIKNIGIGTLKENKKKALQDTCDKILKQETIITWYKVKTGVSDMPSSREETTQGTINRAKNCFIADWSLDLACGAEGWIRITQDKSAVFLFSAVALIDKTGYISTSYTGEMQLPPSFIKEFLDGWELWPMMDALLNTEGNNHKGWAIGYFTHGNITRAQRFSNAIHMAFIPRIHPEIYLKA